MLCPCSHADIMKTSAEKGHKLSSNIIIITSYVTKVVHKKSLHVAAFDNFKAT